MGTIAYFDCFSGISGDMILGALVDLGLEIEAIEGALSSLDIENFRLETREVLSYGLRATKVDVIVQPGVLARTFNNIKCIIEESDLPDDVKLTSVEIFTLIARAEATVHKRPLDQVHFHEIGAVDSIVDIVGAVYGIKHFGIDNVFCSPLPLGHGMIKTQHGIIPVPAPAVLEILAETPVYGGGVPTELVTPTGAAVIKTLASAFGESPLMRIGKVGYGAGSRDIGRPNLLRVVVGEPLPLSETSEAPACVISTNIDDMNPEFYEYVMDKLFSAGAHDVWLIPIQMKKTRPGVTVNVLCSPEDAERLKEMLLTETSTFGLRTTSVMKRAIEREHMVVATPWGEVRVKVGKEGGRITNVSPEFADCAEIASMTGLPLKDIFSKAHALAMQELEKEREEPPPFGEIS